MAAIQHTKNAFVNASAIPQSTLASYLVEGRHLASLGRNAEAQARFEALAKEFEGKGPTMHLVKDNFRNLGRILDGLGLSCVDRARSTSDGMASSFPQAVVSRSAQTSRFS